METAENLLYYLPVCLSWLPYCWPVYTVFKCIYKVLCWKFNNFSFFEVAFTNMNLLFDLSVRSHPAEPGLLPCFLTGCFPPLERDQLAFTPPPLTWAPGHNTRVQCGPFGPIENAPRCCMLPILQLQENGILGLQWCHFHQWTETNQMRFKETENRGGSCQAWRELSPLLHQHSHLSEATDEATGSLTRNSFRFQKCESWNSSVPSPLKSGANSAALAWCCHFSTSWNTRRASESPTALKWRRKLKRKAQHPSTGSCKQ